MTKTTDDIMKKYLSEKIDKEFSSLIEMEELTKRFLADTDRFFASQKYVVDISNKSHPLFISYESKENPEEHNIFTIYSTMDPSGKIMKKHRFFDPKNAATYVSEVRMFPAGGDFSKTVYNNFHTGTYFPASKKLGISGDIFNGENAEKIAKDVMPAYKKFLNDMTNFIKKNI